MPFGGLLARLIVAVAGFAAIAGGARAEYGRIPTSQLDPAVLRIDEKQFLGAKPDPATPLLDDTGQPATLAQYEGKPLILVLSYYNCDGSCSLVNAELASLLPDVRRWQLGRDYRVLTVSFDANDNTKTLNHFRDSLSLPKAVGEGWRFAVAGASEAARKLADSVGFKYFWSAEDRAFLHPGVYVFLSSEGRVVRYLYNTNSRALDVELALTDAQANEVRPSQFINYAVSLCYSYNFVEGRYKLNLPLFAGLGSLVFGISLFLVSVMVFRRRARGRLT